MDDTTAPIAARAAAAPRGPRRRRPAGRRPRARRRRRGRARARAGHRRARRRRHRAAAARARRAGDRRRGRPDRPRRRRRARARRARHHRAPVHAPRRTPTCPSSPRSRELPDRLREGVRLRLTWRQTPAGPAPTPLPQPVLLVETAADGRPGEVLAYQVAAAMARSGVHVAVEVLTSGRPLTSYHAAALRDSTPLSGDAPLRPASPPERVESVVAEVVEQVTAEPPHRAARGRARRAAGRPVRGDDEPAPRPVPMRTWQSGRRRRGFGEQATEAEVDDDLPEADEHEPAAQPGAAGAAHPAAAGGRGRRAVGPPARPDPGRGHVDRRVGVGRLGVGGGCAPARTGRPDDGRWIGPRPAQLHRSPARRTRTPARGHRRRHHRGAGRRHHRTAQHHPGPDRPPAWPVRRPPGRGPGHPVGGPAQHRVPPAGHHRTPDRRVRRAAQRHRHAARRIRCGRRGARRRAGAPRQRPGRLARALHRPDPARRPPLGGPGRGHPAQPAADARHRASGAAHGRRSGARPRRPADRPGAPRSSARRWPRPCSSRRRSARLQRLRPRAAHPAPGRARGRRTSARRLLRQQRHRPERRGAA